METTAYVENGKVMFGAKVYELNKRGRAQAEQLGGITSWLGTYGGKVFGNLTDGSGNVVLTTPADAIIKIAGAVDADAMLSLFKAVIGCTTAETDEWFDINLLLDAVIEMWNTNPAIRKLIERFFGKSDTVEAPVDNA